MIIIVNSNPTNYNFNIDWNCYKIDSKCKKGDTGSNSQEDEEYKDIFDDDNLLN